MKLINFDVPVDEDGHNENLKGSILPEEEMQKYGFHYIKPTDTNPDGYWYMCKNLISDISFNIYIYPNGKVKIDILDEDFCQPYDFQNLICKDYMLTTPYKVLILVRKEMLKLTEAGIIYGWNYDDYI